MSDILVRIKRAIITGNYDFSRKALDEMEGDLIAGNNMQITFCPTCGSKKIKRVVRNLRRTFQEQDYVVPRLAFYECPNCGEQVFDRYAMRKIQIHSPAYNKPRMLRKSA